MDKFPEAVAEKIDNYVYRLIDPRNGQTFYVGRGVGNRLFSHIRDELGNESDVEDDKLRRIRDIRLSGFEVAHVVRRHGLIASMSGRGNCYDNAPVESFFHTLRVESIHGEPLVNRAALRRQLLEYIEIDYNRTRRHSALGYISPDAFEAQIAA